MCITKSLLSKPDQQKIMCLLQEGIIIRMYIISCNKFSINVLYGVMVHYNIAYRRWFDSVYSTKQGIWDAVVTSSSLVCPTKKRFL